MSPQHPELLPLRILIADPCPQSVELLAARLKYWGHEAKAVADGPWTHSSSFAPRCSYSNWIRPGSTRLPWS
jgi:hypothetical protein